MLSSYCNLAGAECGAPDDPGYRGGGERYRGGGVYGGRGVVPDCTEEEGNPPDGIVNRGGCGPRRTANASLVIAPVSTTTAARAA